jgi:hypothetical protein
MKKLTPEQRVIEYCEEQLEWISACREDMEAGTQYADDDPGFFGGMESACTKILSILNANIAPCETCGEKECLCEGR